jgi:hypothetical protein
LKPRDVKGDFPSFQINRIKRTSDTQIEIK